MLHVSRLRRSVTRFLLPGIALPVLIAARPMPASESRPGEIDRPQAKPSFVQGAVRYEAETGVPRAIYRPDHAVAPAAPEAMARQYLSESVKLLRLEDPALGDLTEYFTRSGPAGTTVRFRQTHRGLPVLGSDVAVTIDAASRVLYAANGYETKIAVPTVSAAISAGTARQTALDYLNVQGELAFDRTTLAILPRGADSRLVYQVKLAPRATPVGDWEVLVDAGTGEIVRVVDNAHYAVGTGLTFDPDPLSTAGVQYAGNYVDNNDATNTQLDAARTAVTLQDITDLGGGTFKLQGPYAEITDTESPFNGLFTQGSSTFNYNRFDDNFEAVLCYYHIDNILRYINTTLLVPVAPTQYVGGARFDPHGLNGADNSHYTSSTGEVAFGEGGVDDSEDADVVTHELGHAIHDWLTGGNLSQVEGLSEGTGDYVAQSYSRSLGQWTPADPEYDWVFNWDGHNPFWAGRITNYTAAYPGGLVGQVHTDGQIWATCLMGIWNQIGRDQMDRAVYEGLAMTNGSSSQNDAAQAVLNAASALGYPSPEITVIFNGFTATGYTITAPSVQLAAQVPVLTSAGGNNAADPGETVSFKMDVTNNGSVGATAVSAVLSSSTPGVVIVQGASTYPDLGAFVTGSNLTDYTITLPAGHVCGDPVNLSLLVSFDDGAPNSSTVSSQMGTGVPVGVSQSVSPGLPIPDNTPAGITSTMTVSGTGATVSANLNVDVDITHTFQGDLIVTLESPAGTQVILHNRTGGGTNDIVGNYPGTLTPSQPLSAMIGDAADGDWKLLVSDNAAVDIGTLNSWGINDVTGFTCDGAATAVTVVGGAPERFALSAASPNPFRPATVIRFAVPGQGASVAVEVFDVAGRHVRTLVNGFRAAGEHRATWNGRTDAGNRAGAGIYFYRLQAPGFEETRKVMLLK